MCFLLSTHSINDFLVKVYTPKVEWGVFGALPIVELQLFTVYRKVFDLSICHKVFIKTAFAAIYVNIVKSEVTGTCSSLGNRHVVENVAIAGAVL